MPWLETSQEVWQCKNSPSFQKNKRDTRCHAGEWLGKELLDKALGPKTWARLRSARRPPESCCVPVPCRVNARPLEPYFFPERLKKSSGYFQSWSVLTQAGKERSKNAVIYGYLSQVRPRAIRFVWQRPGSACAENARPLLCSMCLVRVTKHLSWKFGPVDAPPFPWQPQNWFIARRVKARSNRWAGRLGCFLLLPVPRKQTSEEKKEGWENDRQRWKRRQQGC